MIAKNHVFGVVTRSEVKPEATEEFDSLVAKLAQAIRKERGGVASFGCYRVSGMANTRVVIELFVDHIAFLQFEQRPEVRAIDSRQEGLLVKARRVDFLEDPVAELEK